MDIDNIENLYEMEDSLYRNVEMECPETPPPPIDNIYSFEVVGQREECCQYGKLFIDK